MKSVFCFAFMVVVIATASVVAEEPTVFAVPSELSTTTTAVTSTESAGNEEVDTAPMMIELKRAQTFGELFEIHVVEVEGAEATRIESEVANLLFLWVSNTHRSLTKKSSSLLQTIEGRTASENDKKIARRALGVELKPVLAILEHVVLYPIDGDGDPKTIIRLVEVLQLQAFANRLHVKLLDYEMLLLKQENTQAKKFLQEAGKPSLLRAHPRKH